MRAVAWVPMCLLMAAPAAFSQAAPPAAPAHKTETARKPPDISLLRPGAEPLPLSRFRGKVVALTFISTLCSHCQDFTRVINPIAQRYAPRGVQFLECAVNDGAAMLLRNFQTQFQPAFPVGWATQEAMMLFLGATPFGDPHAMFVPHMVLLDRAGLLRQDFEPGSDFYKNPAASVPSALDKALKR